MAGRSERLEKLSLEFAESMRDAKRKLILHETTRLQMLTEESKVVALYEIAIALNKLLEREEQR